METDHQIIIIMSCCYSSWKKSLNFLFGTYMRLFRDLVFVDVQQKRIDCMIVLYVWGTGAWGLGLRMRWVMWDEIMHQWWYMLEFYKHNEDCSWCCCRELLLKSKKAGDLWTSYLGFQWGYSCFSHLQICNKKEMKYLLAGDLPYSVMGWGADKICMGWEHEVAMVYVIWNEDNFESRDCSS